jgi:hypothetical protein
MEQIQTEGSCSAQRGKSNVVENIKMDISKIVPWNRSVTKQESKMTRQLWPWPVSTRIFVKGLSETTRAVWRRFLAF